MYFDRASKRRSYAKQSLLKHAHIFTLPLQRPSLVVVRTETESFIKYQTAL